MSQSPAQPWIEPVPVSAQPPSIHTRAVITWIAIFPLVSLGFFVIAPFSGDWHPVLRAFVLTLVVVPTAVYLVVPQLMRAHAVIQLRRRSRNAA